MSEFDPRLWAWLWVALTLLGAVANVIYSQRRLRQIREQALQRSLNDIAGAD